VTDQDKKVRILPDVYRERLQLDPENAAERMPSNAIPH
jgi:hypothetical protein